MDMGRSWCASTSQNCKQAKLRNPYKATEFDQVTAIGHNFKSHTQQMDISGGFMLWKLQHRHRRIGSHVTVPYLGKRMFSTYLACVWGCIIPLIFLCSIRAKKCMETESIATYQNSCNEEHCCQVASLWHLPPTTINTCVDGFKCENHAIMSTPCAVYMHACASQQAKSRPRM